MVQGRFALHTVGKPLSREETRQGQEGFDCLKELFGEEGEHVLMEDPPMKDEGETLTTQERHETIFRMFGKDGIKAMCDITQKLRKARFLTTTAEDKEMEAETESIHTERRTQACVPAKPLYPAKNDVDNSYNQWAAEHVDAFLPDGADRTSRTDPNKLITDIQDSINEALEAEYNAMACYPIMNGVASIASIPDLVIFQQGSLMHGIKNIVCNFGSKVSGFATDNLYKQLARAQFHDYHIDGAESRATYMNTASMANQVCTSSGRLNSAVEELESIKRALENRRD